MGRPLPSRRLSEAAVDEHPPAAAKPVVGVVTDIWPSASHPENGPYVRELSVRLSGRTRQLVLVPRLVLPRAHVRLWGDSVQGRQRGHDQPGGDVRVIRYPMLRIPKGTETAARSLGSRLVLRVVRERPAMIHGHFLFAVAPAAVKLARTLRVPVLLTAHGTDARWLGDRSSEIRARHHAEMVRACLEADAIAVTADWMIEHFVDAGVPPDRLAVIPMGVDETVFVPRSRAAARAELGIEPDVRLVLFVGRATPEKGSEVLAAALERLGEQGRAFRCCVAGSFGIRGTTHLGMLPPARLAAWMSAADVVCLPSYSEGMPVAVSEALACGTPVVASAVGGMREQIEPGRNGLLVPVGDSTALADALAEVVVRDWDATSIRATSERFWWPSVADRYGELYDRLLARS